MFFCMQNYLRYLSANKSELKCLILNKFRSMILIADSGSTKTHWCLINNGQLKKEIFTNGINPFYQTEEQITAEIAENVLSQIALTEVSSIKFYGAGCSFPDKILMVENALKASYPDALMAVSSDLLAAARGLFAQAAGIACILGTGSNSCYYDGCDIVENVSPLGYILGDEGSGAVLGKLFIADVLKRQLSEELISQFFEETGLAAPQIMEAIYKKPFPNRYLAQFTRFMHANLCNEQVRQLVYRAFCAFFERNVKQYNYEQHKTAIVGSIAFYFQPVLRQAASDCGVELGDILQSPMTGLIAYHTA